MDPEKELIEAGVIDKEGNLVEGVWRNGGWRELHINVDPFFIQLRELDDDQRIFTVDPNNAPFWAEDIVKYIYDRYNK